MTSRPDGNGAVQATDARPEKPAAAADLRTNTDEIDVDIDEEALLAEFEAEKPARKLTGMPQIIVKTVGVGLSLFGLYWVFNPLATQAYLPAFLMIGLAMTFLAYRGGSPKSTARAAQKAEIRAAKTGLAAKISDNPHFTDWLLALVAVVPFVYILSDWDSFFRRAVIPTNLDVVMGTVAILVTLEATRRTVGMLIPIVVLFFFAYAFFGPYVPAPFNTASYDWSRLVGHNVMATEGLFGVPTEVAATYIILFTIYGAVLTASGATRFFIDLSFAAFGRSTTGPGRTVTLAGFLLGTVSGSGVATTVTLGGISWPLLRRAGYPKEHGGALLAAAGIGAIMAPPMMGAAAFIIAALLGVSYLQVIIWAIVPTLLYYFGLVLAIEMDARRFRTSNVKMDVPPFGRLLLRFGYHFSSLGAIVVFMVLGMTPFRAVVFATLLAVALSFLDRQSWITPKRLWDALAAGATSALSVLPVMAAAGLIVGVMTLTGLGLKLSNIIVSAADGSLLITAILSAISVTLLGLAVPVTASFIISWVIIGPALQDVGVPAFAAAMFIFYYSVLSEVSPPTALSPFAASAITGGKPVKTMWLTWKYTMSAFLVPFIFVLSESGLGLLLQGGPGAIVLAVTTSAIAVTALAIGTGGWLLGPASRLERILIGLGAIPLVTLSLVPMMVGLSMIAIGVILHLIGRRRHRADTPTPTATTPAQTAGAKS